MSTQLHREHLHPSVSDPVLSTMNFLNEVTLRYPQAISFAPGRPFDGFFDGDEIFTHIRRYLEHLTEQGFSAAQVKDSMYQYGPTAGLIRDLIAESLRADEGIDAAPEAIVVTVGSQEAMLLTLRVLMARPTDSLLVVTPCYVGVTGAARLLNVPVATLPERDDGLDPADVDRVVAAERARGRTPRALYVVPDHSNPSGSTMPLAARHRLLERAADHDLLVVEDSPYRLVGGTRPLPTLKALDTDRRVVHLGSYSKTLMPGARVGFVVADQTVTGPDGVEGPLADELAKVKSMVTVNTSPITQALVGGALLACRGRVSEHSAEPAAYYGSTMRATLAELDERFPADVRGALGVRWNRPEGGFFLTLQVPFIVDDEALDRSASDFGVIWTPMAYFYPGRGGERALRLSTSYLTPAEIREGIERLGRFVASEAGAALRRTPC